MPQLGILGNYLVRAAKDSDSSVATVITTQKQTIEKERKARLHKVSAKPMHRKRSGKKRPYQKKEGLSQESVSSESSKTLS